MEWIVLGILISAGPILTVSRQNKKIPCFSRAPASAFFFWSHVNVQDWNVNVVEQLSVELDRHAGGEEHHQLLGAILLQEGEE